MPLPAVRVCTVTSVDAYRYPDGPRLPKWTQAALAGISQLSTLRHMHRRYGDVFTIHVPIFGKTVVVADPALIKQTFTAPPDVLYAGERSPLRAVLGDSSLLTIDGTRHLAQRKLLLPPFHGERMRSYEQIVREEALRELADLARGRGAAHARADEPHHPQRHPARGLRRAGQRAGGAAAAAAVVRQARLAPGRSHRRCTATSAPGAPGDASCACAASSTPTSTR